MQIDPTLSDMSQNSRSVGKTYICLLLRYMTHTDNDNIKTAWIYLEVLISVFSTSCQQLALDLKVTF